jgi:methylated-DNA-[protein]-cysteine S-methyltransferase
MSEISWGWIAVVDGVVAVIVERDRVLRIYYLAEKGLLVPRIAHDFPTAKEADSALLTSALMQLTEYFDGKRTEFELPVSREQLTPFGHIVHQVLSRVPYGEVITYGELARRAGSPRAARAVGRVMAENPFPIIVPCHRVVRADGRVGEYSGGHGAVSKSRLIENERRLKAND